MRIRFGWVVALAVACAAWPAAALAASITGLGFLPLRNPVSFPNAISEDGSVVVGISFADVPRSGRFEAFRWEGSTGMIGLGVPDVAPGETPFSEAYGVSADGSFVVGVFIGSSGWRDPVGWRFSGGTFERVPIPGLGIGDTPSAVTPDGSIVVGDAFRVEISTGHRSSLADLPGGATRLHASGVSADGRFVVGLGYSDAGMQAVRWDESNVPLALAPARSQAFAVSANGAVVVGELGGRAFRWDETRGLTLLSDVSGADLGSSAIGMSADGSIVVGGYQTGPGIEHAVLWDLAGFAHPLEALLAGLGVDLSGWSQLERATAISADGTRIVGYGIDVDGNRQAWLAVIPEPGTGLSIGIGLALLAAPQWLRGSAPRRRAARPR
ncbi:MAG: PEP-CTERM sorting domain-containing protein [Myxococcota bacterium]